MSDDGAEEVCRVLATLPRRIRVGPLVYTVETCDVLEPDKKGESAMGFHEEAACRILLLKGHYNPVQVVVTMLHELIHALTTQSGCYSSYAIEERYASALSYGFAGLFKNNPGLVDWIKNSLETLHD
jgi:hypothetical protein